MWDIENIFLNESDLVEYAAKDLIFKLQIIDIWKYI